MHKFMKKYSKTKFFLKKTFTKFIIIIYNVHISLFSEVILCVHPVR